MFKSLTFYQLLGELLKPKSLTSTEGKSLLQESRFSFAMTSELSNDMNLDGPGSDIHVLLRICLNKPVGQQMDRFPPILCIRVNSKICEIPRPTGAINISSLCKLCPIGVTNNISISWAETSKEQSSYIVGVFLARKLSPDILLAKLKRKDICDSDHSTAKIKQQLTPDVDSEIQMTSLKVSLLCPLSQKRIETPCRAINCNHIQSYDALAYCQFNELKNSWICPVCQKEALFDNLLIDGLFVEILNESFDSCTEVEFECDGTWRPVSTKLIKKRHLSHKTHQSKRRKIEIISIDSSADEDGKCSAVIKSSNVK